MTKPTNIELVVRALRYLEEALEYCVYTELHKFHGYTCPQCARLRDAKKALLDLGLA